MYTMVKNIDYPRDSETHVITAAVHPNLQVEKDDGSGNADASMFPREQSQC